MSSNTKPTEILDLEFAALSVLAANPQVADYAAFRSLFEMHVAKHLYTQLLQVEWALMALDRGEVELPSSLPFARP